MSGGDTPPRAPRAAELRALLGKITPLPWGTTRYAGGFDLASGPLRAYAGTDPEYGEPRPVPQTDDDVMYAVAAANALPVLLTERDDLRAMLRRLEWCHTVCVNEGEHWWVELDYCPACGGRKFPGHGPDCALAALLGAEGEGGDGT